MLRATDRPAWLVWNPCIKDWSQQGWRTALGQTEWASGFLVKVQDALQHKILSYLGGVYCLVRLDSLSVHFQIKSNNYTFDSWAPSEEPLAESLTMIIIIAHACRALYKLQNTWQHHLSGCCLVSCFCVILVYLLCVFPHCSISSIWTQALCVLFITVISLLELCPHVIDTQIFFG